MYSDAFLNYLKHIKIASKSEDFLKYKKIFQKKKNIIILGNGGSNSVASHIAQDMTKFHNKKATSFSEPSMITCFANDFGYENAFVKYLEFYADKDFLVIVISSSGESKNIINVINFLEKKNISYGILTGFKKNNTAVTISKKAIFKYHVESDNYGIVECMHQIFLHNAI